MVIETALLAPVAIVTCITCVVVAWAISEFRRSQAETREAINAQGAKQAYDALRHDALLALGETHRLVKIAEEKNSEWVARSPQWMTVGPEHEEIRESFSATSSAKRYLESSISIFQER